MESSILSEVDDTSILRTCSPRRYSRPLNWLPASRLLPRAAGWSAATLCFAPKPTFDFDTEGGRGVGKRKSAWIEACGNVAPKIDVWRNLAPSSLRGRLLRCCRLQMRGEKGAHPHFRIFGSCVIVFDPVAVHLAARLQLHDIEGVVGARINRHRDRRAVRPGMPHHVAAAFSR